MNWLAKGESNGSFSGGAALRERRPVKVHRIHAFPPFSFSVQNRLQRIVRHALHRARLVAGVTHRHELAPSPGRRVVKADAKTHSMLARDFFPSADDVHLGTDVHRVPRLIFRIPAIEIVVMNAHRHEVTRPHFDIQDPSTPLDSIGQSPSCERCPCNRIPTDDRSD